MNLKKVNYLWSLADAFLCSNFFICIHQSSRRTRNFPWQTALFEDSIRAAGIQGIEIGTKLYVSNLDYGVTNEDIRVYIKPCNFVLCFSIGSR